MKIGIFGKLLKQSDLDFVKELLALLLQRKHELWVHHSYFLQLEEQQLSAHLHSFEDADVRVGFLDCLFSIGGDGTLLHTIRFIKDSGIPILGVNIGRLGFLTGVVKGRVSEAIEALEKGNYLLDHRSLLQLTSNHPIFEDAPFALNELTIQKKETSSMVTIHTYVNGEFLNSFWADGLILATPTGSTAYALSVGGPIIAPTSKTLLLAPISPHNLTVRPIVISDNSTVTFQIEGRAEHYFCTLDSQSVTIDSSYELTIRKAEFTISLIRFEWSSFYQTIRSKLMWGVDTRQEI
ncbi:MAG: NAD kinase [Chitinophagales bacterium]